jgi:hypothetical protein
MLVGPSGGGGGGEATATLPPVGDQLAPQNAWNEALASANAASKNVANQPSNSS